jgi:hypothetical protein
MIHRRWAHSQASMSMGLISSAPPAADRETAGKMLPGFERDFPRQGY